MEQESTPKDTNSANIFFIDKQFAEREPSKEGKRLWRVNFDQKGNIIGLPERISPRDVIIFEGNDGSWWAENPSPEILEEIQKWRSDWHGPY